MHESILPCSVELNQDLVGQHVLLLVTHSVCALRSYPKPLVHLIYDHELTLGLRPFHLRHVLSFWAHPCGLATTLGLSSVHLNSPQTEVCPLHASHLPQ